MRNASAVLFTAVVMACSAGGNPPRAEAPDAGADDAAVGIDAGASDAGLPDSGLTDAGSSDGGEDAGLEMDAGEDAGAGVDGGDAGEPDAGEPDAGPSLPDPFGDGGVLIVQGGDEANGGVEVEAMQLFQVPRSARPGGTTFTVTLRTNDNFISNAHLHVDVIELTDGGPAAERPASRPADCSAPDPGSIIATGLLNRQLLTFGVAQVRRLNFVADQPLVPGRQYAMLFRSEHPSSSAFELRTVEAPPTQDSGVQLGDTYLRAFARRNGVCEETSGWLTRPRINLDEQITLDDGCVVGTTVSCGRGACYREVPECDAFGEFQRCHPNSCTTSADCRVDWVHPERGTYPDASCTNPTGGLFAGLCPTQAEVCNGIDDDCNGDVDENLPMVTCGTGACQTTIDGCDTHFDSAHGWLTASPSDCAASEPPPSPEQCDGTDNDCNGVTDDNLPQTATCGFGACRRSISSCVGGEPATCTPDYTYASTELCNGLDDDCDGTVDDIGGNQPGGPFDTGRLWQYYYPPPSAANITLPNYYPPSFTQPVPGVLTNQGQCHYGRQLCSAVVGSGIPSWGPDSQHPWVTPVAEAYPASNIYVCDGLDNDCDGYIDNVPSTSVAMFRAYWPNAVASSFPSARRTTGQCQDGVETCRFGQNNSASPDQNGAPDSSAWLVTTAPVLPQHESCNGLDDDCDGAADNGLGQQVCGVGVCQTTVENCGFVTNLGWTQLGANCRSGGYTNPGNTSLVSNEICNGLDDNCDDATDWDSVAGQPLSVTCHPLCDAYNTDHLSSGTVCKYPGGNAQGACRGGLAYCVSGAYQSCGASGAQTEIGPQDEVCNGIDDDCDGATDNLANRSTALKGMCSPACTAWGSNCHPGFGQCRQGTATCSNGAYVTAECAATEIGPSTDVCNGFDDDCDSYSDNVPGTSTKISTATWWSCAGATNPTAIAACGARLTTAKATQTFAVGECHAGSNSCSGGNYATVKTAPVGASAELCNGLDDDCDGNIDNTAGQASYSLQLTCSSQCASWAAQNPRELACIASQGQCRNGTATCTSSGWGGCPSSGALAERGPSAETCNGFDDNCDGYIDNGVGSSGALAAGDVCQSLCDSWRTVNGKASDCIPNTGQCRRGTGSCNALRASGVASWTGCFGEVGPSTEFCNGFDDDCDGSTDTIPGSTTKLQTAQGWSCSSIVGCKYYGTINSGTQTTAGAYGACRAGTSSCVSGSYGASLSQPVNASVEICNGVDDDCDGYTDNVGAQIPTALKTSTFWSCSGFPGCVSGSTGVYAVGQCRAGTSTCSSGSYGVVNKSPVGPSGEICNGLDDNCDGTTDEGCP